jgi:DNA polymerase-3 subunit delta
MEFNAVLKDLKAGKFKPVYFLQGEEPYFIDQISDYIAHNVLDESERDFNQSVLYGKEVDIQQILNEAKQYPMMADYRVVIVKEAQELTRTIANLQDYITNPTHTTILVICFKYKKVDGKTKFAKDLKKLDYVMTTEKIRDYKLPEWIIAEGKNKGLTVAPNAAMLLAENLGDDLSKIVKTFEKLQIVLAGDTLVDEKTVHQNVGISKEYNVFELQKALTKKDILKANMIGIHFGNNPKNYPLVMTISSLYGYFSKVLKYHALVGKVSTNELPAKLGINPFFVKDYASAAQLYPMGKLAKIIGYLRDADLQSKGVGSTTNDEKEILKELIYKIMH